MSLKHGILGLLSYEDMTGYDLSKYFEQSLSFFWNAQKSQIYRDLKNLEKKDLVEYKVKHQEEKPDKKIYSITKKGQKELVNWINQYFKPDENKVRDPFLMRVFFSAKGNTEKLKKALKDYIKYNKTYLKSLEKVEDRFIKDKTKNEDNDQFYWYMTIRKGYYNLKANINWAEEVLEMMNSL